MKQKVSAILFDLDGVLVETREQHYYALVSALRDLGFDLSFEEHFEKYDGLPTFKKIEILRDRFKLTDEQVAFLNQQKQHYTMKLLSGSIKLSNEHRSIFEHLRNQNIKIAICSNTKRKTLDYIIDHLGIGEYLEFSLSNEDISEPKPSPEIYEKAMKRLNVTPEETVIFEDSPHGLESARKSKALVEKVNNVHDLTLARIQKIAS